MILSHKKVKYLNSNTLDPLGRVFEYDGRVFRGIYKSQEHFFWELWNNGLIGELVQKKLIPVTEIATDIQHDEFSVVLIHEKIIYTDPTAWTFSMLKDAAVHILKVNDVCNKYGFELLDGHPYNVSFDRNTPLFIDIGSISWKQDQKWKARHEFLIYTIFPLILMQFGHLMDAYMLLSTFSKLRFSFSDFTKTSSFQLFLNLMSSLGVNNVIDFEFDENWINSLIAIKNDQNKSIWSSYSFNDLKNLSEILKNIETTRYRRIKKIAQFIDTYCSDASSLIDLGGNVGITSMIIKEYSRKTNMKFINTDYDYASIEESYNYLKTNNIEDIQSYLLNIVQPLAPFNFNLKSDIALALALTHHLLLTEKRTLDEILQRIIEYSNNYVIIEFMPLGLWGGDPNSIPDIPNWYNIDFFKNKLNRYVDILHIEVIEQQFVKGQMRDHRVAFVCRIRK